MNRKDRRRDAKNQKQFRLIQGGKVSRDALVQAFGDRQLAPPARFAEALGTFLAAYDQWEQAEQQPADHCAESEKLAILLRLCSNRAIQLEVPLDQWLDGVQVAYEEQAKQLESE